MPIPPRAISSRTTCPGMRKSEALGAGWIELSCSSSETVSERQVQAGQRPPKRPPSSVAPQRRHLFTSLVGLDLFKTRAVSGYISGKWSVRFRGCAQFASFIHEDLLQVRHFGVDFVRR